MSPETNQSELLALTAEIVSAHVAKSAVTQSELPELIRSVHDTLSELSAPTPEMPPTPAVPVKKSVGNDRLVCLECGKSLKTLKRHLRSAHDMTPEEYRARWDLRPDYPMVAPAYSEKRQELAKDIGLGRKPKSAPARGGRKKAS